MADTALKKEIEVDSGDEIMELQMGPSHPATHGTIKFNLKLDGEVVEYVTIRPDRRVGQPVGTGDYWVIADEAGECLFLYKAEAAETFEITD